MKKSIFKITISILLSTMVLTSLSGCRANHYLPISTDKPTINMEKEKPKQNSTTYAEKEKPKQNTTTSIEKEIEKEDGFHSIEEYEKANKDSFNKVKEEAIKSSRKETAEEKVSSLKEQSVRQYHEELLRQQGLKANSGEITRTEKGNTEVSYKETKVIDKEKKEGNK